MPTLRIDTPTMPASRLGATNPLPDLRTKEVARAHVDVGDDVPADQRQALLANDTVSCLPYRLQDDYDRSRADRPLRAAVLENDRLRVVFLLDYGGRMWSLLDKAGGRELLYQPRVLHFTNVALRNAWMCGGVEWNIAMRGHAAHTCSPVFAARLTCDDGSDALRLYEYDRFRGLVFQIDFLLPDGSHMLLVRPRVVNPNPHAVRMYWWSNIAVPEAPGHRVVVPAEAAHHYGYRGEMEQIAIPLRDGVDTSYPTRIRAAHDYFYSIPPGHRPWIAGLDADARGLVHASSRRLKGRKLFVWGMSPGGRRWQEHLGGDGRGYVELQGGLGRTQSEYLAMPAGADWDWLEAYMPLEADASIVHGDDWPGAYRHVEQRLDELAPQEMLELLLAQTRSLAERPPQEILHRGGGWGALEQRRRRAEGGTAPAPPSMPFDEASLAREQAPWLALLDEGQLPHRPPQAEPGAWMTAPPWRDRLAAAVGAGRGDHWLSHLHLGVMAFADGDAEAARQGWQRSLDRQPSPWAYRNLAVLAEQAERHDEAADLYLRAVELDGGCRALQIECCQTLTRAERFADLDRWLAGLPDEARRHGRVALAAGQAALRRGDLDAAEEILERIELADVREGEVSLTDLWFAVQARRLAQAEGVEVDDALRRRIRRTRRPPKHLDYRMHA